MLVRIDNRIVLKICVLEKFLYNVVLSLISMGARRGGGKKGHLTPPLEIKKI